MPLGKPSRVEKQASSPLCFKATIVFFVAACILALWMMNSSSSLPVQRENFPKIRKIDLEGTRDSVDSESETSSTGSEEVQKPKETAVSFEDSPGDLPEDAIKGDEGDETDKSTETEQKADQGKREDASSNANAEEDNSRSGEDKEDSDGEEKKTDGDDKKDNKVEGDIPVDNGSEAEKEIGKKIDEIVEKEKKQETASASEKEETPEILPNGGKAELLKENNIEPGNWETQAAESKGEKERQDAEKEVLKETVNQTTEAVNDAPKTEERWKLCKTSVGPDYIPCLDNTNAIKKLPSTSHFQHRERHCPEEPPTCLVPLPEGYKTPIRWPESRDKIWFNNVPHTKLAEYKKTQNWVKVEGEYTVFPGGGTQFKNGAQHYIEFIEETIPDVAWGNHTRVILDVGCGVASFGGFLFDKDVLTMSLAPKDEHEAQVQLALERGIPAISAVMGTQRLPFPSGVFDVVHCARCRVKWHADGGRLLLELNRMLRPGGFFVWSATPIYQTKQEDVEIWKEMSSLTANICWNLISKKYDDVNEVGVAIYQKPTTNECYERRRKNEPAMCNEKDDPNAAWYVPMESCLHRVPTEVEERGTEWPVDWPQRLQTLPFWLKGDIRGKFQSDTEYWERVVSKSYLTGMGIDWDAVRNVMDMKAVYGGFAASLKSKPLWVMNVVPIDAANTLPIIYERGLFGIHHDWCQSFSTYPRSYDLVHADHLFSKLTKRCKLDPVIVEVDRILRPGGSVIFRDNSDTLNEIEALVTSLHYEIRMKYSQNNEAIICAVKTMWRPSSYA